MAYIKVNHSELETAADAVDKYVTDMKKKMRQADGRVSELALSWQGEDAARFQTQWRTVTNGDATYTQMVKSLESYAKFLRFAAKTYRDAQIQAVNQAAGLPRY